MRMYLFVFAAMISSGIMAQHQHEQKGADSVSPLSFAPVLTERLSDPELSDFQMESSVMTIVPGGEDTVAHRHDCDLFGYVLSGTVLIGLENNTPKKYVAGQMFFEKRNILHTVTKNGAKQEPARILLLFIIKKDRPRYTAEYKK